MPGTAAGKSNLFWSLHCCKMWVFPCSFWLFLALWCACQWQYLYTTVSVEEKSPVVLFIFLSSSSFGLDFFLVVFFCLVLVLVESFIVSGFGFFWLFLYFLRWRTFMWLWSAAHLENLDAAIASVFHWNERAKLQTLHTTMGCRFFGYWDSWDACEIFSPRRF